MEPLRPGFPAVFADDDPAFEVYAGCHDHAAGGEDVTRGCSHAADAAVTRQYIRRLALADGQIVLSEQRLQHAAVIGVFVLLRPQAVDRGPLGCIEHAPLQQAIVCRQAHFTAQGVHLAYQLAFACPADGRVAGHQGDGIDAQGQKQRLAAQPGRCQSGLAPGVPRADDNNRFVHLIKSFMVPKTFVHFFKVPA